MEASKMALYTSLGLVLSLLLNAFMLGFLLAGPALGPARYGPPPPPHHGPAEHLYKAAENLAPERKEQVVKILHRYTKEIDAHMHQGMSGFKEIRDVLQADELDPENLDAVFARMAAHHKDVGVLMGAMFEDLAAVLPDKEERMRFFEQALPPEPPFPPQLGRGPRGPHEPPFAKTLPPHTDK